MYRFGRFTLDRGTRQLLHDRDELHLSPKAFDLLVTLIRERPRAMPKAELLERLWPATFVEETNLAGLIAEIRRALHDSATRPSYLRTMYRFGYRFVGDVIDDAAPVAMSSSGPRPCLVFDNKHVLLIEGANVIGRAPDATIRCDASGVSRHHARIVLAGGEATIEDLGSKNGTFVRRRRLTSPERLSDGDEIRLGRVQLIFRVEAPPGATDTLSTDTADSTR